MPSHTVRSISARERLLVSSDDARMRCSTAARWRSASAASWPCSITPAAISQITESIASGDPLGGSSSERIASGRPSEAVSGTVSASSPEPPSTTTS